LGQRSTFRWAIGKDSLRSAVWRLWALLRVAHTRPNLRRHRLPPALQPPLRGRASLQAWLKAAGGWSRGWSPRPSRPGTKRASRAAKQGHAPGWCFESAGGAPPAAAVGLGLCKQDPSAGGGAPHRWPAPSASSQGFGGQLHQGWPRPRAMLSRVARADGAAARCRGDASGQAAAWGSRVVRPQPVEAGTKHRPLPAGSCCRTAHRSRRNSRSGPARHAATGWRCRHLSTLPSSRVGGGSRRPRVYQPCKVLSKAPVAAHDGLLPDVDHQKGAGAVRCILAFTRAAGEF